MSRSIKLQNNTYLDSAGISHNRELLSTILNKLQPVVLYSNDNGSNGIIELNDNYTNYSYIEIITKTWELNDISSTGLLPVISPYYYHSFCPVEKNSGQDMIIFYIRYNLGNQKYLYPNTPTTYEHYGTSSFDNNWHRDGTNNIKVIRVIGYK